MREGLTTAGEIVGGITFSVGCGLIFAPLGLLAAGVLLILFCYLAAR